MAKVNGETAFSAPPDPNSNVVVGTRVDDKCDSEAAKNGGVVVEEICKASYVWEMEKSGDMCCALTSRDSDTAKNGGVDGARDSDATKNGVVVVESGRNL
jgi:hypothetical protein